MKTPEIWKKTHIAKLIFVAPYLNYINRTHRNKIANPITTLISNNNVKFNTNVGY